MRGEGRVRGHGQRPQSPPHSLPPSRCPQAPASAEAAALSLSLCPPWLHWAGLGVDTLLFLLVHPRQGWNFPAELFTRQLKGKTRATTRSASLLRQATPSRGPRQTPEHRRRRLGESSSSACGPSAPFTPRGSPGGQAGGGRRQLMSLPGWLRSQDLPEAASGAWLWDGLVMRLPAPLKPSALALTLLLFLLQD